MSNIETKFEDILNRIGYLVKSFSARKEIDYANTFYSQYPFEKYHIDFVLLSIKLAIEIDGHYWHATYKTQITHKQANQKISEIQKTSKLMHNGWTVIRIKESDFLHTEKIQKEVQNIIFSLIKI